MSSAAIALIPPKRRDLVFNRIRGLVNELDAIDRSLGAFGEGLAVDECLEQVVDLIGSELKDAKKRRARRKAA